MSRDRAHDFAELATAEPLELSRLGRLRLVVLSDTTFVTHPLPPLGVVTLGRGEDAGVRIEDPSISRLHAELKIEPSGALWVRDLGSSNGSFVRGARLPNEEWRSITTGEVVDLGQTMMVVQHGAAGQSPRRFLSHGSFELRLEEECARARAFGRAFSVLRLTSRARGADDAMEELLLSQLRPFDLLARDTPQSWEVLLVEMPRAEAQVLLTRVEEQAERQGLPLSGRLVNYPEDGRDAEHLVEASRPRKQAAPAAAPLVVKDGVMQQIHRMLERIAPSPVSVLVLGETGAGKEIIAETIHRRSERAAGPFLRLNCGAFTESLLESELFGHEKGAFSGALATKPGLLESAHGGTVFLDEVGELSPSLQVKLLRVLEERQVRRVGALSPLPIDVRFVSATNRDLEDEVAKGRFRMDLFYRLNGITLVVPPLRERREEILPLAESFLAHAASAWGRRAPELGEEAKSWLLGYPWPGNIRELKNVMERAVLLADRTVTREHLPVEKMGGGLRKAPPAEVAPWSRERAPSSLSAPAGGGIKDEIEALEKQRILEALEKCQGVHTRAAKMLGWSRGTLLSRLEQYGLSKKGRDRER